MSKKHRSFYIFSELKLNLPSPVQQLSSPLLTEKSIQLFIKRDDLIHPELTGNKWRKLKYNLLQARHEKKETLLTFGGAYSNHIHAVSAAGHLLGFKTVGIIRGERAPVLSPTLVYAESMGMHLHFVTREAYKNKSDVKFIDSLNGELGDFYLIPEGGSNDLAVKGVKEIVDELEEQVPNVDCICSACGTGGTLAGLIEGVESSAEKESSTRKESSTKKELSAKKQPSMKKVSPIKILGFPVLKNANWMYQDIQQLLRTTEHTNWSLALDYHFGGYAKYDQTLIEFIRSFEVDYSVQLEPVYTAKMLYGIFDLIKKDYFPKQTTIVAIHTGGLQGLAGIAELN